MAAKKHKGLHEYRFASNGHERIAADHWSKAGVLPDLLGDGSFGGRVIPSDRDYEVAATVAQWLGSPVGRCWLDELHKKFAIADAKKGGG